MESSSKQNNSKQPRSSTEITDSEINDLWNPSPLQKKLWKIMQAAILHSMNESDVYNNYFQLLIKSINIENVFDLWRYAKSFEGSNESLELNCTEYILKNIIIDERLNTNADFLKCITINQGKISYAEFLKSVTIDELEEMLSFGGRIGLDEECLHLSIKWILSDFNDREKHLHYLMDKIQFERIDLDCFVKIAISKDVSVDSSTFLDLFARILKIYAKYRLTHKCIKEPTKIPLTKLPNIFTIFDDMIIGYDRKTKYFFSTKLMKIPDGNDVLYPAIIPFGNNERNIFICGGRDKFGVSYNNCKYISFKENKWNDLPSMLSPRLHHRALDFRNKIYVCGGCNGVKVRMTEYFDMEAMGWFQLPNMNYNMIQFGLTNSGNCLYALNTSKKIEFLDFRANSWIKINEDNNMNEPEEYIYRALDFQDNIIYCFGDNNIFQFDVRMNKYIGDPVRFKEHGSERFELLSVCYYEEEILMFEFYKPFEFCIEEYNKFNLQRNINSQRNNLQINNFNLNTLEEEQQFKELICF